MSLTSVVRGENRFLDSYKLSSALYIHAGIYMPLPYTK